MNNLRNVAAMALLVAMLVGMTAVAPATPVAKASTQVVPTSSLTESVLQDWVNYLDEARPQSKLDSLLTSYKDTGIIPSDVAVGAGGKPSVLIAISKGADIDGLKSIVDVKWMMDFKVAIVVSAYVDRANLDRLQNYKGVAGVLSDRLYTDRKSVV